MAKHKGMKAKFDKGEGAGKEVDDSAPFGKRGKHKRGKGRKFKGRG